MISKIRIKWNRKQSKKKKKNSNLDLFQKLWICNFYFQTGTIFGSMIVRLIFDNIQNSTCNIFFLLNLKHEPSLNYWSQRPSNKSFPKLFEKANRRIKFAMGVLSNHIFLWNFDAENRSSRPEVFCKNGALKNLAEFTGKHLCQSPFFNKVAGLRPLLKKRLWHRCFPVNFASFLRTCIIFV